MPERYIDFVMLKTIARKIVQQLVTLAVILLILYAALLSLGRQLIPAVADYKPIVEAWLRDVTGVAVSIESLTGRFDRFNPVLEVNGLRLLVPVARDAADGGSAEPEVALEFGHATLAIDVGRSVLFRRWELQDFVVEDLDAHVLQQADGEWQLRGMNRAGPGLAAADIYRSLLQVSRLELRNVGITLQPANGELVRIGNSAVVVQNQGSQHFFHIDADLDPLTEPVLVSVEVRGNRLDAINGRVHLSLPSADYSTIFSTVTPAGSRLDGFDGAMEAWLEIADGAIAGATVVSDVRQLTWSPGAAAAVRMESFSGLARWQQDDRGWSLSLNRFQGLVDGRAWQPADYHVEVRDRRLSVFAQQLDLEAAMHLGSVLGVLNESAQSQLTAYGLRGELHNLAFTMPLPADTTGSLRASTNLRDVAVNSVNRSPSMTGISGYLEASYDFADRRVRGRAEVASDSFSINIPSVFTDTWQYDEVLGALDFQVDAGAARRVHLVSNVVRARSDLVNGRAQFESDLITHADGSKFSNFTLLVGATDVDGSRKTPYLPSAPGQRQSLLDTMRWLDGALIDARVDQAGVIFRGSVLPGSAPAEKTFQSFYDFRQGHLRYQPQWPDLVDAAGRVLVNDRESDIVVSTGASAGLQLTTAVGSVRPQADGELRLQVAASVSGPTQSAVDFLATAPLGLGLDQVMTSWQADGEVTAELELQIPLNRPGQAPGVSVAATLDNNDLAMPDFDLRFAGLQGSVNYSSSEGLHDSLLEADFFGSRAEIRLQSLASDGGGLESTVRVSGHSTAADIHAWPGQSQFVRNLLSLSDGEFDYVAELRLPGNEREAMLRIDTDLEGVALNLPQPLGKANNQRRALHIELGVGSDPRPLSIQYGADLNARMHLQEGRITSGVAWLGTLPGVADPWVPRGTRPGLEVRGNLDDFRVTEWISLLSAWSGQQASAANFGEAVAMVNLDVGNLDLFGERLPLVSVTMQQLEGEDFLTVGLDGTEVAGSVLIPFGGNEPIEAYLSYLRLPGEAPPPEPAAEGTADQTAPVPTERVDPLAGIDPRRFPRLRFHTGAFSIGERDYGQGQFTLEPTADGAVFSDLVGNFRGLQLGLAGNPPPTLRWQYDGRDHHSYLTGIITAGDLADVLSRNGYAASLESRAARFDTSLDWPGSPAFFSAAGLSGQVQLNVRNGRFLQRGGGSGALKLISILNFDAIMRRARFSDDLLRRGLAYDEINGNLTLANGIVNINDRLIMSGPSSVYQIAGQLDLVQQTINGEMYLTLPVSDNIPWLGLLTANIPLAIGAYLFERIFGDQVDNLTSAQYTLQGPWEGLEPQFKQAFGTLPAADATPTAAPPAL